MNVEEAKVCLREKFTVAGFYLSNWQIKVIVALVVIFLLGAGFLYYRSQPCPATVQKVEVKEVRKKRAVPRKLVVHVCGAVTRPGVYEVEEGERVVEAIQAAGGPAPKADLNALNLASRVKDGQKIYVPQEGEKIVAESNWTGGGEDCESVKINLNTATTSQLEELSGIGPVLAQRIFDFRTKKGGFTSIDQLQEVEGIGPKKFEGLKGEVAVE